MNTTCNIIWLWTPMPTPNSANLRDEVNLSEYSTILTIGSHHTSQVVVK